MSVKFPLRLAQGYPKTENVRLADASGKIVCIIPNGPDAYEIAADILTHINRRRWLGFFDKRDEHQKAYDAWIGQRNTSINPAKPWPRS